GPDPRNFNQRVSLGRNDLLIRTFPNLTSAIITQRYPPKYAKDQSVKAYRYAYDWPLTAMLRVIQGLSPGEADLFLELARSV
ncbi:hypothetical protein MGS57_24875, partial [Klebsiella pneumoniae]|nr:hypothetical protein [Klebsiella pneumoniae]